MYLITNTTYVFLYNKHLDANKKFPMAQNIMWLIQTECHTIVKHIMMKYTMNNSIYRILGISYHLDVNPDRQKKREYYVYCGINAIVGNKKVIEYVSASC